TLDKEAIKKILSDRLGSQAEKIVAIFYDELYREYEIPQDLELAIDLIEKGQPLPRSKLELYEATLKPIFNSWKKMNLDYEEMLCRRAYEMLLKKESFESAEVSLPTEIRNSLEEGKLLFHRGGQYQFRHDLIRAYLAAKYFKPRWRQLLVADVWPD